MGRIEVLDINSIKSAGFNVKNKIGEHLQSKHVSLIKQHGQIKLIVVAHVEGNTVVIDGDKYLETCKEAELSSVNCKSLGHITPEAAIIYRLFLNYHEQRLDYIGVAEAMQPLKGNKTDSERISIRTGIPFKDIERFCDLIDFDWSQYLKLDDNNAQIDMFQGL